jgi:hypothetical protein
MLPLTLNPSPRMGQGRNIPRRCMFLVPKAAPSRTCGCCRGGVHTICGQNRTSKLVHSGTYLFPGGMPGLGGQRLGYKISRVTLSLTLSHKGRGNSVFPMLMNPVS